jgi:23S rRNA pseudouridine1911/1915/1917 synthase
MQFVVGAECEGKLLRNFLRECGVSAALLARLKRQEDGILQNGTRVTVRAVLHAGDLIELAIEDREQSPHVAPRDLPVGILLHTADLTVANKPANMPTHPSHGHHEDTLANALAYRFSTEEAPFRPRFINRLDRNTTGVVLVANHALAAISLSSAMAEGEIKKTYLALVHGRVEMDQRIETGIRRREGSTMLREVCDPEEGARSVTDMQVLFADDGLSLVKLIPQTGRTHQLRVHMAHLGHPLLGDELYGIPDDFPRHALHAWTLEFPAPQTGERIFVRAPLPDDMRERILLLGREAAELAQREGF